MIFFKEILSDTDQYLIIKRTLFDLGERPFYFYSSNNISNNSVLEALSQLLGGFAMIVFDSNVQNGIDEEYINDCMVYDFSNVLLSVIQTKIETTINIEEKKNLLTLKYRLIFGIPSLEHRVLKDRFLVESSYELTNISKIESTGISLEEYEDNLDERLLDYFSELLVKILYEEKVKLIDEVLFSTFTILLSDEAIFKQVLKSLQNYYSQFVIANQIIDIMTSSRNLMKDHVQKRKSLF